MKTVTMYQVREFVGNEYSKQLGRKLRDKKSASKIVKMLKKQKRVVFLAPMKIAA